MTKKRKTDDVFKLYRSFVKAYPISKFVVATKCVEYLHQFEMAQHCYNKKLKFDFSVFTSMLITLEKQKDQIRLKIVELKTFLIKEYYFKTDDEIIVFDQLKRLKTESDLEESKIKLEEVVLEHNKTQVKIDNISIEGKVCQLDFSKFITTDTILGNTFEIGLVTDERKKGDVVGRKGILAADLTRQESEDEDEVSAY